MTVTAAGFAFLLDVSNFATRRELTIASDDASAGESGEAKKPNETHKTLKPTASSNCQNGEQVPYPETTDFLGVPSLAIIGWVRARWISTPGKIFRSADVDSAVWINPGCQVS
jgi:hypothetical protein